MTGRQPDQSEPAVPAPHRSQRRTSQAHAFDQLVDQYETAYKDRPEQVRATAWLIERLHRGAMVLDIGCGTGIPTARQLVDAGIQLVGIDISPAMVAAATTAVPEATIRNCDILDFTDTGFDGAVAFFSLLMLPKSDIPQALSVLHNAIKPGGYLLIGMVEADLDDTPVKFLDTDIRVSGYHRDELRQVVHRAGFVTIEIRASTFSPPTHPADSEVQLYVLAQRFEPESATVGDDLS